MKIGDGINILVVDDERAIREMIVMALEKEGFSCAEAADGHRAEAIISKMNPDLALVDWMMPGLSGINFIRKLRKTEATKNLPIIMLTAKTEEGDMIKGLECGADDYITKPFSPRSLIARINALYRRSNGDAASRERIEIKGLIMDFIAHRVQFKGQTIEMGPTEFRLLQFFMRYPDRVFSRSQILNQVWLENVYVEERTVDVHIRRLRKALAPTGHDDLIQTVRNVGYRLS